MGKAKSWGEKGYDTQERVCASGSDGRRRPSCALAWRRYAGCLQTLPKMSRLAQAAWIAYLVLALPGAVFCVGGLIAAWGWAQVLPESDSGPRVWLALWPVAWGAGLTLAHWVDRHRWRVLPYLWNAVPVGALLVGTLNSRPEADDPWWLPFYLPTLLLLLLFGAVGAWLHSDPQGPEDPAGDASC